MTGCTKVSQGCKFQPTRPRGARRRFANVFADRCEVSTHAPARGATSQGFKSVFRNGVSTHAPARGATLATASSFLLMRGFNPRAREGRDLLFLVEPALVVAVSTHAPARGATATKTGEDVNYRVSTHAPARGATLQKATSEDQLAVSTHAPARGATKRGWWANHCAEFQPTRPRGARHT